MVHTVKGLSGTIGAVALQDLGGQLESCLSEKDCDRAVLDSFEEMLKNLVDDLGVVLENIATEQTEVIEKKVDPNAREKLKDAVEGLRDALDKCSSTHCKRILEDLECIAFEKEQESLIEKLKDQVEDYDFTEAADTLDALEKTLKV